MYYNLIQNEVFYMCDVNCNQIKDSKLYTLVDARSMINTIIMVAICVYIFIAFGAIRERFVFTSQTISRSRNGLIPYRREEELSASGVHHSYMATNISIRRIRFRSTAGRVKIFA